MSLNPAIGKLWYEMYGTEVEDNDSVVMRGMEMSVPRYYDKLRKKKDLMKPVKRKRLNGVYKAAVAGELRPSRVEAKEIVKLAQFSQLKRTL